MEKVQFAQVMRGGPGLPWRCAHIDRLSTIAQFRRIFLATLLHLHKAHRTGHLGATIDAHDSAGYESVGPAEAERNRGQPPCCLPQSPFLPPCWLIGDRVVKRLIWRAYERQLEHFPGRIRVFSLMQGGVEQNPEGGSGGDRLAVSA
jgi:hypothetical protein